MGAGFLRPPTASSDLTWTLAKRASQIVPSLHWSRGHSFLSASQACAAILGACQDAECRGESMVGNRLLIPGCRIVHEYGSEAADLLIEGQSVRAIAVPGSFDEVGAAEVLEVTSKLLLPGLIYPHDHFPDERLEEGAHLAAAGATLEELPAKSRRPGRVSLPLAPASGQSSLA